MARSALVLGVFLGAALGSGTAFAQAKVVTAVAPAGAGQPALAVGFDASSRLFAKVCPSEPCAPTGGEALPLPESARPGVPKARLNVVGIGRGRRAIVVSVPSRGLEWQAILVAPLNGVKPKVVFQGWTGLVEGQEGERRGPMVAISELEPGEGRRIVVGEQREELSLCGRPALLAPKLLSAEDLELKPARVQRLSVAERDAAKHVTARRLPESSEPPKGSPALLHAVVASSAIGSPAALTDGDPETTWAENRGADGRGEFVLMNAPPDLPLTGFELSVRPAKAAVPAGAAPREFWLATSRELVHVTMPENAWNAPGARYEIALEQPVTTDCVALVVESSFDPSPVARVTFGELRAKTAFDAAAIQNLVGALAGGGERSQAAAAVLRASGAPAHQAVAKAFTKLDEGGRRVALDIIDSADCATSVEVYLHALLGPYPAQRTHAEDRLRRCGDTAAARIVAILPKVNRAHLPKLANELALIAPERAPRAIAIALESEKPELRRDLRVALARAAAVPRAASAFRELVGDPKLPEPVLIEVLRAIGPGLPRFLPEAGRAFNRIATPSAEFRTRYLLLEPAAELEAQDAGARAFLRRSLATDSSPQVRAQAARVVRRPPEYQTELLRAVAESELRVREAALETLGARGASFATPSIVARLEHDDWPLIRAAAATALGSFPKDDAVDKVLGAAIDDASPHVRAPVVRALGTRGAVRFAPEIRGRLADDEEAAIVRAAAAGALGQLCDRAALDLLTRHATELKDPMLGADQRMIAPAALAALARLHPPDLAARLKPLLGESAPVSARRAAAAALAEAPGCPR